MTSTNAPGHATGPSGTPIQAGRMALLSRLLLPLGAAVAFIVVLSVSFAFGQRNERMLALVQRGYYPNIETSHQLSALLKGIHRGLYDAVDAADASALVEVDQLYATFQSKLTEAEKNPVADRKRLNALREAMSRYYPISRDAGLRLIHGDTFASLTPALETMKSRHLVVDELLEESLRRDYKAITSAFAASRQLQRTTTTATAAVVAVCIAALFFGSLLQNRLAATQARNEALLRHHEQLEEQVGLRTHELSRATCELTIARDEAVLAAQINDLLSRRNRAILDSAGEGIFGLDRKGIATFINPAAARMLGWTVDELLGQDLHQRIHPNSPTLGPEEACDVCRGAADLSLLVDRSTEFCKKDGSSISVDYTAQSIASEDGAPAGVVVTFRDASERRAIERMKDEFVSTVSHELRTPLTSIRGALGILSSDQIDRASDKYQRMLTIATSNADRLVRLTNDILDLERIGSGKTVLACTFVEAHAVMRQTVEGIQAMADKAGVRLQVEPADASVWVDTDRIIQTLTNLVSNAIKFSPREATVRLTASMTSGHCLFRVSDQGRGIPADQLETIFERFQQVDASDSRDKGGTGLGLAICRSIVQSHGGEIWAESSLGSGSTFSFTIPTRVAPEPGSMNGSAHPATRFEEISQ
jgi:PAS domain S-box-containing protein